MNLRIAFLVIVAIFIIAIFLAAIPTVIKRGQYEKKALTRFYRIFSIVFTTIAFSMVASFICLSAAGIIATAHGMPSTNITIQEMFQGITHSRIEDNIENKNLDKTIVIYYKFGCPDCEDIFEDLYDKTYGLDDIYWVSTQSKQGKKLLKKYPVKDVPTGIYIRGDTANKSLSYTQKKLHTTDSNGNTVLNIDALERLIYLKNNDL